MWKRTKEFYGISYEYDQPVCYNGWYHTFYITKYDNNKIYTVYMNGFSCWEKEFKKLKDAKRWVEQPVSLY